MQRRPVVDRFWEKVDKVSSFPCWLWLDSKDHIGYGRLLVNGTRMRAHRVAYELLKAPIPSGLSIDHLCCNKLCVNPDHLEPVTHQENMRRHYATKTHCVNGHEYTIAGWISNGTKRTCRACRSRSR